MLTCVCVCVCEREREREREFATRARAHACVCMPTLAHRLHLRFFACDIWASDLVHCKLNSLNCLSTRALSGGLYANPLEMDIQSAVACSEAKGGDLLVSWQLVECVLVWVVSSSLAINDFLKIFY